MNGSGIRKVFLLFSAVVLQSGCSSGDPNEIERQPVQPARGVVMYKNKPVADASVTFQSLDGKIAASGTTDAAGTFVLSTYGAEDGAPVGKYRVLVSADTVEEIEPGVLAPEPEGGFKSRVPTKYSSPDTSDLLFEITEDGKNEFIIELD